MPQQNIEFQRGVDTSWVFQNLIDASNSPLPSGTCASLILEHVVGTVSGPPVAGAQIQFISSLERVAVATTINPVPTDTVFYRMAYGLVTTTTTIGRTTTTTGSYVSLDTEQTLPLYAGNRRIVSAPSSPTTGSGGGINLYLLGGSVGAPSRNIELFSYLHTNSGNVMPSLYTFSINHSTGTIRLDLTALGTLNNSAWSSVTHPLGAAYAKRWDAYGFPGFNNVEQKYEVVLNIPDGNKIRRVVGAYGTFKTLDRWTKTTQANYAPGIDCPVLPSGTGIL